VTPETAAKPGLLRRQNPGDTEAMRKGSSPEQGFELDLGGWETISEDRRVGYSHPSMAQRWASSVLQARWTRVYVHTHVRINMRVCECV